MASPEGGRIFFVVILASRSAAVRAADACFTVYPLSPFLLAGIEAIRFWSESGLDVLTLVRRLDIGVWACRNAEPGNRFRSPF